MEIHGSSEQRPRYYQNHLLMQLAKRKIRKEDLPLKLRKRLWIQFTQIYQKTAFYENIHLLGITQSFISIIDKDLIRTRVTVQVRNKARQALVRFSQYNPYIGYCQGMHSIAIFFIEEGLSAKETFFVLKKITETILPCDYFSQMNSIVGYMRIFYEILPFTYPAVHRRMEKIISTMGCNYMIALTGVFQWFVCLFCNNNFRKCITRVIIDAFMLEGVTVLFKAGLAILEELAPHILACNNYQQYSMVEKRIGNIIEDTKIKERINSIYLNNDILELVKDKILEKMPKFNGGKRKCRKQEKKCNQKWNVCLQTIENNFVDENVYECFVFKSNQEVQLIPDYFNKLHKHYFKPSTSADKKSEIKNAIVVGRMEHTCRHRSETLTEGSLSDKRLREELEKNIQQNQGTPIKKSFIQGEVKKVELAPNSEEKIREQITKKLSIQIEEKYQNREQIETKVEKKGGLIRSESVIFMQQMVKNSSISNLLDIYDFEELFD